MYHISGHILWRYSLKNRPENRPKIYGIGTSNKSVPEMAIDGVGFSHSIEASPLSDKPIHPSIYTLWQIDIDPENHLSSHHSRLLVPHTAGGLSFALQVSPCDEGPLTELGLFPRLERTALLRFCDLVLRTIVCVFERRFCRYGRASDWLLGRFVERVYIENGQKLLILDEGQGVPEVLYPANRLFMYPILEARGRRSLSLASIPAPMKGRRMARGLWLWCRACYCSLAKAHSRRTCMGPEKIGSDGSCVWKLSNLPTLMTGRVYVNLLEGNMYSNRQVGGWYLLVRYPLFCVSQPSLFVDETY